MDRSRIRLHAVADALRRLRLLEDGHELLEPRHHVDLHQIDDVEFHRVERDVEHGLRIGEVAADRRLAGDEELLARAETLQDLADDCFRASVGTRGVDDGPAQLPHALDHFTQRWYLLGRVDTIGVGPEPDDGKTLAGRRNRLGNEWEV